MEITIDAIKAAHSNVAAMIAAFEAKAPRIVALPATQIELHVGEHYAGMALDEKGAPSHHLILMAQQGEDLTWDDAIAWAKSVGGELPSRSEQALLYANLKPQFEQAWYWSREQHATNSGCAWFQLFYDGSQHYGKPSQWRARAVRRLIIL